MAYEISDDGVITMFKGDYVEFMVDLPIVDSGGNATGEVYQMQDGDTLTLTVRKKPIADSPVEFSTTSTTNKIIIVPADTKDMDVGKYSADIQLNSGGKVTTIFPLLTNLSDSRRTSTKSWDNFVLVGEVTL